MHFLSWIHTHKKNNNNLLFYVTFLLSVSGTKTKLIDKLSLTASLFCSTLPHIKRNGSYCEEVTGPHTARSHMHSWSFGRASRVTCLNIHLFDIYESLCQGWSTLPVSRRDRNTTRGSVQIAGGHTVTVSRSLPSLLARLRSLVSVKEWWGVLVPLSKALLYNYPIPPSSVILCSSKRNGIEHCNASSWML